MDTPPLGDPYFNGTSGAVYETARLISSHNSVVPSPTDLCVGLLRAIVERPVSYYPVTFVYYAGIVSYYRVPAMRPSPVSSQMFSTANSYEGKRSKLQTKNCAIVSSGQASIFTIFRSGFLQELSEYQGHAPNADATQDMCKYDENDNISDIDCLSDTGLT